MRSLCQLFKISAETLKISKTRSLPRHDVHGIDQGIRQTEESKNMTQTTSQRLAAYQDFGFLDEKEKIRLKRSRDTGAICVEKHITPESAPVYRYLAAHPNPAAPEILECIETESGLTVIEEYIEGETLEELLGEGRFSAERAAGIILDLCSALLPLHSAEPPIICRDLKAENVMIDKAGAVRIVDFDIARTWQPGKTRDTRLLGTREYAAPEQFGFRQTDARTDIYALGVLLNYLMLRKFPAEESLSGTWGEIVGKCTRMDPEQRYQNVGELAEALRAALDEWDGISTGKKKVDGSEGTGVSARMAQVEKSAVDKGDIVGSESTGVSPGAAQVERTAAGKNKAAGPEGAGVSPGAAESEGAMFGRDKAAGSEGVSVQAQGAKAEETASESSSAAEPGGAGVHAWGAKAEETASGSSRAAGPGGTGASAGEAKVESSAAKNRLWPPGFRTCKPWKMVTASLVYLVLTVFCFTLEITEDGDPLSGGRLRFEQTLIWLSQLLFIGILFNYCGMRDRLPLVRNRHLPIRILGLAAAWIILFGLAALIAVLAEGLW